VYALRIDFDGPIKSFSFRPINKLGPAKQWRWIAISDRLEDRRAK
jgi:hypothetical protein